jgi:flagellar motor switch protein FliG
MRASSANNARNLRKAAILLASLDAEHAEAVLRQMTPAQAQALRQAVDSLGHIQADEQGQVIEEFFLAKALIPPVDSAGLELDTLAAASLSLGQPSAPISGQRFEALRHAPPRKLVPFLKREHPQTVALVISHLPAYRAAEILAHLPAGLQADVARRLVDLEETSPEVLEEVERGLESWLTAQERSSRGEQQGVSALAAILGAADPQARRQILENLSRHDRQLAEQLDQSADEPCSFTELDDLDDASLLAVLRQTEPDLLVLALAGAAPMFAQRALSLLGPESASLRHQLAHLGPARMSDIEQAQARLIELAQNLKRRDEVRLDTPDRFSLAI